MKKALFAILLLGAALASFGEMDSIVFTPVETTAGQSKAVSYVMRGELESIKAVVGIPASTSTITIASGGRTLFTGTKLTGTNWYQPRIAVHGQTGSALTWTTASTSGASIANALVGKIPLAGPVTVTFLDDTVGVLTNKLVECELIFSK